MTTVPERFQRHRWSPRASFNCGTAIALVAYGKFDAARLHESSLGKVIDL